MSLSLKSSESLSKGSQSITKDSEFIPELPNNTFWNEDSLDKEGVGESQQSITPTYCEYSLDGKYLLIGYSNGRLELRQVSYTADGDCMFSSYELLVGHEGYSISCIALSQGSITRPAFAVVADLSGQVIIRDIEDRFMQIQILKVHYEGDLALMRFNCCTITLKSEFIAIGGDLGVIHVYNTKNWEICNENKQSTPIRCMSYSGDGKYIAIGYGEEKFGRVQLLDMDENLYEKWRDSKDMTLITPYKRIGDIKSLSWIKGDRYLVVADGGKKVNILTPAKANRLREFVHKAGIIRAAFSVDGKYLYIADESGVISIINSRSWKEVQQVNVEHVTCVAITPTGYELIVGCSSGRCFAFTTAAQLTRSIFSDSVWEIRRAGTPLGMQLSPDGKYLIISDSSGVVSVIDAKSLRNYLDISVEKDDKSTSKGRGRMDGQNAEDIITTKAVAWSTNGLAYAMGDETGKVSVMLPVSWSVLTEMHRAVDNKGRKLPPSQWNSVEAIAISERSLAFAKSDSIITLMEMRTWIVISTLTRASPASVMKFSPSGHLLAIGEARDRGGRIIIMDTGDGKILKEMKRKGDINCLAFSWDGRYLGVADASGRVSILFLEPPSHDLLYKACVTKLVSPAAAATVVSFGSDNRFMAYGDSSGRVVVVVVDSWTEIYTIAYKESITHLEVHRDKNEFFMAYSGGKVICLKIPDSGLSHSMSIGYERRCVQVSPNEYYLSTGDSDGRVTVYQIGRNAGNGIEFHNLCQIQPWQERILAQKESTTGPADGPVMERDNGIHCIQWSPDSRVFAVGDSAGYLTIYNPWSKSAGVKVKELQRANFASRPGTVSTSLPKSDNDSNNHDNNNNDVNNTIANNNADKNISYLSFHREGMHKDLTGRYITRSKPVKHLDIAPWQLREQWASARYRLLNPGDIYDDEGKPDDVRSNFNGVLDMQWEPAMPIENDDESSVAKKRKKKKKKDQVDDDDDDEYREYWNNEKVKKDIRMMGKSERMLYEQEQQKELAADWKKIVMISGFRVEVARIRMCLTPQAVSDPPSSSGVGLEEDVVETLKVFETKLPVSCVVWSPSRRFIAVGCTSHPASKPLAPVVVPEVDTNGDIIQDPNVTTTTNQKKIIREAGKVYIFEGIKRIPQADLDFDRPVCALAFSRNSQFLAVGECGVDWMKPSLVSIVINFSPYWTISQSKFTFPMGVHSLLFWGGSLETHRLQEGSTITSSGPPDGVEEQGTIYSKDNERNAQNVTVNLDDMELLCVGIGSQSAGDVCVIHFEPLVALDETLEEENEDGASYSTPKRKQMVVESLAAFTGIYPGAVRSMDITFSPPARPLDRDHLAFITADTTGIMKAFHRDIERGLTKNCYETRRFAAGLAITWAVDNKYFAITDETGRVTMVNTTTWQTELTFYSPQVRAVLCIDDGIPLQNKNGNYRFIGTQTGFQAAAWSVDGKYLCLGDRSGKCRIFKDIFGTGATGTNTNSLGAQFSSLVSSTVVQDTNDTRDAGSDGRFQLIHTESVSGWIFRISWSPCGRFLAFASSVQDTREDNFGMITILQYVYNSNTDKSVENDNNVSSSNSSSMGNDAGTWTVVQRRTSVEIIRSLAFTDDGEYLAYGDDGGVLQILYTNVDAFANQVQLGLFESLQDVSLMTMAMEGDGGEVRVRASMKEKSYPDGGEDYEINTVPGYVHARAGESFNQLESGPEQQEEGEGEGEGEVIEEGGRETMNGDGLGVDQADGTSKKEAAGVQIGKTLEQQPAFESNTNARTSAHMNMNVNINAYAATDDQGDHANHEDSHVLSEGVEETSLKRVTFHPSIIDLESWPVVMAVTFDLPITCIEWSSQHEAIAVITSSSRSSSLEVIDVSHLIHSGSATASAATTTATSSKMDANGGTNKVSNSNSNSLQVGSSSVSAMQQGDPSDEALPQRRTSIPYGGLIPVMFRNIYSKNALTCLTWQGNYLAVAGSTNEVVAYYYNTSGDPTLDMRVVEAQRVPVPETVSITLAEVYVTALTFSHNSQFLTICTNAGDLCAVDIGAWSAPNVLRETKEDETGWIAEVYRI